MSRQLVLVQTALVVMAFALVAGPIPQAFAWPPYQSEFTDTYPDSTSIDAGCQLCHVDSNGGEPWNAFGWKLREFVFDGAGVMEALILAEELNSDADPGGFDNLAEIDAGTYPGWTPGPNNSYFFTDGSTTDDHEPPPLTNDYDPAPSCDGDANGDMVVNVDDLLAVLGGWGGPGPGDVNGDGSTNVDDVLFVLGNWGVC